MRVAALYDIHGNLPALEAVIEDIARLGADQIVVGGDVVPGPMPRETLSRLLGLNLPTQFIVGNGEIAVLAEREGKDSGVHADYREGIRWNAAQLRPEDCDWLKKWPTTLRMSIAGLGKVLFCHATPQNPNDVFTRLTPETSLMPIFCDLDADVVVCGHTHMQFDRTIGRIRVINAGSVGMPFGQPGAFWLHLDPEVKLRCSHYDLEEAASRIRKTHYPEAESFATQNIVHPPSEEKMLAALT